MAPILSPQLGSEPAMLGSEARGDEEEAHKTRRIRDRLIAGLRDIVNSE